MAICSITDDCLEITALRVDPAAEEGDGVLAQCCVERVSSPRVSESLNNESDLVVQRGDLSHAGGVLGVLRKSHHLCA